jgi:glutathione synthase/RimK-type ligase-like ATP-grasp enzyme
LGDVFLVSCWEAGEVETESIIIKEALTKRGIESSIVFWDDPKVNWGDATLVICRTPGSYVLKPEKFIEWAKTAEETSALWNPSPVIEWNYHKRYLLELQENGIPMPETILIPQNTEQSMNGVLESIPWDDFIIKPCISGGSAGLLRFTTDSSELEAHFRNLNRHGFRQTFSFGEFDFPPCDTLIQPYLPEITENGEVSLIFFAGEYSHAVIKKPPAGDYRAHPIWGAEVQMHSPSAREVEVAYRSLEVVGRARTRRYGIFPRNNG